MRLKGNNKRKSPKHPNEFYISSKNYNHYIIDEWAMGKENCLNVPMNLGAYLKTH
jgi:hypothetical protein